MSLLPATLDDRPEGLTPRQLVRAKRAQASTELAVFNHGLEARALAEIDRLDSEALGDASRAALEEEIDLLDYGLRLAGQSAAKAAIVARHVERTVEMDDRRIRRRLGSDGTCCL